MDQVMGALSPEIVPMSRDCPSRSQTQAAPDFRKSGFRHAVLFGNFNLNGNSLAIPKPKAPVCE
jgi:hypothetical protein